MESSEPARKKAKLEEFSPKMEYVVDDTLLKDIEPVEVFVGKITNKKLIREVIIELNSKHPIQELSHLKRVKSDRIVLCLAKSVERIEDFLAGLDVKKAYFDGYESVQVPASPPLTRKQFESANKLWPCNFHENKDLEKLVNSQFTQGETERYEKWMMLAVEIAQQTGKLSATVVIDPATEQIVCKTADGRNEHPMHHSVMLAIDLVAKSQGGGAWSIPSGGVHFETATSVDGEDGPYLCTGYDVFTTREPCVMCAMALVHSRAKRVFYNSRTENGALGSKAKIHLIKDLNHHFEVIRGVSEVKCDQIIDT